MTTPERVDASIVAPALAVAAFTSIGSGAIVAAAIGGHSDDRQTVVAFAVVALAQLAWGVVALTRSGSARTLALVGAAINLAAFGGWVLAKTSGISFIDGLERSESPHFADVAAAAFAVVAVIGALLAATVWRDVASRFGSTAFGAAALATAVVTIFGMIAAGTRSPTRRVVVTAATPVPPAASAKASAPTDFVPPKPYDPTKPIDLGGVPGVTPQEQARAENLLAITLVRLPQWSDPKKAEAAGFVSIGDAVTGDEHYVNLPWFDDGRVLDPDHPESLVYEPDGKGGKKLAAAMYMLKPGTRLTDAPDIGGNLTQWHIHNNLCFTSDAKVASLRTSDGPCPAGQNPGVDSPMIHVWIEKHPCGPFAALEGVGAGQIKPGEQRLCDQAHSD
jgi:hypothetical protein